MKEIQTKCIFKVNHVLRISIFLNIWFTFKMHFVSLFFYYYNLKMHVPSCQKKRGGDCFKVYTFRSGAVIVITSSTSQATQQELDPVTPNQDLDKPLPFHPQW
jgi:hypothetical protein